MPEIDQRWYDAAGRVTSTGGADYISVDYFKKLYGEDASHNPLSGNGTERKLSFYNANSQLVVQNVSNSWSAPKYSVITDVFDGAGNQVTYRVKSGGSPSGEKTYTNTFVRFEGYKEASVQVTGGGLDPAYTNTSYDANGVMTEVKETSHPLNDRKVYSDLNGQVVATEQGDRLLRQLIVNGEVLGRYGQGVLRTEPRNGDGNPNFDDDIAEFEFGYRSILPSYPGASPGSYVVRSGDTLRSIAQSAYGDSRRWYQIADANGIGSDSDLRVGHTLNLPNLVGGSHNASGDFTPYDPTRMVGDTSPQQAAPPKKSVSFFKKLLAIAIAVIVTIYTAGAFAAGGLSNAFALGFGNTMTLGSGSLAAGVGGLGIAGSTTAPLGATAFALAGAAGSVASQAFAVASGMQDKFNWKGVAQSALSSVVGGSLGPEFGAGLGGESKIIPAMARAAAGSVITQGIGVVTGLQRSFSWQSVAASAVGAGVGQAIGATLRAEGAFDHLGRQGAEFARGAVSGLVGGLTTAVLRGGRVDVQQVGADAFGNALGSSLADMSQSGPSGLGTAENRTLLNQANQSADADYYGPAPISPEQRARAMDWMLSSGVGPAAGASSFNKDPDVTTYPTPWERMFSTGNRQLRAERQIAPGAYQEHHEFPRVEVTATPEQMREAAAWIAYERAQLAASNRVSRAGGTSMQQTFDGPHEMSMDFNPVDDGLDSYAAAEGRRFSNYAAPAPATATGSNSLDSALESGTAALLTVAGAVHGAVETVSDQLLVGGNLFTGGWLANNYGAARAAAGRNITRSEAILGLPRQVSTTALRVAMVNWRGMDPLNSRQIDALEATGDKLGAKVLAGQTWLNVIAFGAGGVGALRASGIAGSWSRPPVRIAQSQPGMALQLGIKPEIRLNRADFSPAETAWINYKYGIYEVRAAAGAETSSVGAGVAYQSRLSRKFARDTLAPGKPIASVRIGDVAPGKNVDEFVSRQFGGRQVIDNQNWAPARANQLLGTLEHNATKHLPAGTPIVGFHIVWQ